MRVPAQYWVVQDRCVEGDSCCLFFLDARLSAGRAPSDSINVGCGIVAPAAANNDLAWRLGLASDLRQEPRPPFGLVDPNLDQTGGGDIIVVIANLVCGPQTSRQLLVVIAQFADHLERSNRFLIVIFQSLVFADVADGTDRCPADLARPFRDVVGHGEDLRGLLVEQQVVVAKVLPAHVPVKVLRLYVKREDVGKQSTQVARYFFNGIPAKIRWRCCFIVRDHCSVLLSGYEFIR